MCAREVVKVGNRLLLYENNVDLKESISCFTLTIFKRERKNKGERDKAYLKASFPMKYWIHLKLTTP